MERIVTATEALPNEALRGITALVDSSLVRHVVGPGGEPRYTMLETIREFGLEQLAAHQEVTAGAGGPCRLLPDVRASGAAPVLLGSAVPDAWLDRLAADHDNLRAALGVAR